MVRVREQAIELLLDYRVALTGPCLQARPVTQGDVAAVVLDQAGPLHLAGGLGDPFSAHPEHVGVRIKEADMNWNIVEGNWKQFKGEVKTLWGRLTDDQLDVIAGKRIELAGKIQEAYGITEDEAEEQIKRFELHNKDKDPAHSA